MTIYYFASRYSRHPEMRAYRDELEATVPDAKVVARWIDCHDEELEQSFTPETLNADPAGCWRHGRDDLADLRLADVIVSFTGAGGKGGRHIEHGYAMAMAHWSGAPRIVIVGERENIFHCEPDTEVYPDWASFLAAELERFAPAPAPQVVDLAAALRASIEAARERRQLPATPRSATQTPPSGTGKPCTRTEPGRPPPCPPRNPEGLTP